MKKEPDFYCPVYRGNVSQYDCDEIQSCNLMSDGLPFLLERETIMERYEDCLKCKRHEKNNPLLSEGKPTDSRVVGNNQRLDRSTGKGARKRALRKFSFIREWRDDADESDNPKKFLKIEMNRISRSLSISYTKSDMSFSQKIKRQSGIVDLLDQIENISWKYAWDKHVAVQPTDDDACSIELIFQGNEQIRIDTKYTRQGMPYGFAKIVKDVNLYIGSAYEKIDEPRTEFENGMVIYCACTFEGGGKTYYYRTANRTIKKGDYVIVPVGDDKCEKTVRVESVEYYKINEAPMPIKQTRKILRKLSAVANDADDDIADKIADEQTANESKSDESEATPERHKMTDEEIRMRYKELYCNWVLMQNLIDDQ